MILEFLSERLGELRSEAVINYLQENDCELRISKPRVSKLGDFSFRNGRKKISVNSDLNKYRFALTLVHEMAHLKTYSEFQKHVPPHGKAWKQNYKQLLIQFDIESLFSETQALRSVYDLELENPKACSGIKMQSEVVLSDFDDGQAGDRLGDVAENQRFTFRRAEYVKIRDRRTRVLCRKLSNQRLYTISKAAIVQLH